MCKSLYSQKSCIINAIVDYDGTVAGIIVDFDVTMGSAIVGGMTVRGA
jgi:hypothetical protein